MKALIYFPLTVLVLCSILSMCGLGSGSFNYNVGIGSSPTYYDSNGHSVIFGNSTIIGESGTVYNYDGLAYWVNSTGGDWLFTDVSGSDPLIYSEFGATTATTIDLGSSLGLIALLIGVMALAVVAGLSIFGTGTSDTSVSIVVICTAYLTIWGIFSALTSNLLMQFDAYGWIIYFVLTILYTLGIISSFSGAN